MRKIRCVGIKSVDAFAVCADPDMVGNAVLMQAKNRRIAQAVGKPEEGVGV